jgi:hypothetical protein
MHALLVAAAYVFTPVVVPGQSIVTLFGPNDKLQVVVTTDQDSGIYQDGTFTPLPSPPPGYQVRAMGINNTGVIVGLATTGPDFQAQGFILHGSAYTFFSRPGWKNTEARAIGNSGLVTGWSVDWDTGKSAGFVYDPRTVAFTDVTPAGSDFTIAQGINKFGQISGNGRAAAQGRYAFIWQQGTLTKGKRQLAPFLDRLVVANGGTSARGINDAGVIAGFTSAGPAGPLVGFVGNSSRGYELLIPPGAAPDDAVTCDGINNFDQVTCSITDAAGTTRGFIGSPRGGEDHDD